MRIKDNHMEYKIVQSIYVLIVAILDNEFVNNRQTKTELTCRASAFAFFAFVFGLLSPF